MREKDPFDKVLIMPSGKALDAEPRDDAKTRAKSARALVVSELPRDELRREPAPKTLQSGSRTLFDLRLQRSPEWVRVRHGKQTRHDLGDHIHGVPGTRGARMTKQEGRDRRGDPVLPVPAAPWFMWGRPCDGARGRRCGWWCSDAARDRGERRPSPCGRGKHTIHRSLSLWSRSSIVSHTSPPSA